MPKRVLIRTDASYHIGTGHVRRCIALAKYLRNLGMTINFACRNEPGNLINEIQREKFPVKILRVRSQRRFQHANDVDKTNSNILRQIIDADALSCQISRKYDLIILDNYFFDINWENLMRSKTRHIFVLDDLANRHHYCELLLDQSLGRSPEEYKRFIVNDCELLLGPKYFIIREEIRKLKQIKKSTLKERVNILITLGGFAFSNIPVKLVSQLLKYYPELNMNFYMNFQYYHPCLNKHKNKEVSFFKTEQLTEVLPHVDFAITAAGMTLYEMVYLGIPTFILPLNELQKKVAFEICKLTPAKSIPDWKNTDVAKLAHSFVSFINSTLKKNKHKKAFQLIDGLAIDRIALKIEKLLN